MQALRDIYRANKTSAAEDQDAALEGTLEHQWEEGVRRRGGGGLRLNGNTREDSGSLLNDGCEDGRISRTETDVFVSVLEQIQYRVGRRQRAETHFCVPLQKSRQNRNFMTGNCTTKSHKTKPDSEWTRAASSVMR